ncbi:MAG: GTP cyclohydrolase II, partial [Alphaproteobacteria bacterium]
LAVVLAAEAATAATLARVASLAGTAPVLALTGRRAAVLGLTRETVEAVTVAAAAAVWDTESVRRLADPALGGAAAIPHPEIVTAAAEAGCGEAAIRLTKIARLLPAALVAMVVPLPPEVAEWTGARDLQFVDAAAIAAYPSAAAHALTAVSEAHVPLEGAEETRVLSFRPADGGIEHLAIVIGTPDPATPVLVRLHSECFTGDLLGSLRCDCGDQLRGAVREIAAVGAGVLLYLAQEGRGIGLANKLRAYALQDEGYDTYDANAQLGFDDDERVFLPAAEILRRLGFGRVRLMTNNQRKVEGFYPADFSGILGRGPLTPR